MTCNACESQAPKPHSYFELAENAYRSGQYEIAHQNYGLFLRQNPDPQLARLAERRMLSIEREIDCVLGKKSGPRPAYVNCTDSNESAPSLAPGIVNRASALPQ